MLKENSSCGRGRSQSRAGDGALARPSGIAAHQEPRPSRIRACSAALLWAGESEIELLEPLNPDNGVGKFLARRGGGLHHLCFETERRRAGNWRTRAPRGFNS